MAALGWVVNTGGSISVGTSAVNVLEIRAGDTDLVISNGHVSVELSSGDFLRCYLSTATAVANGTALTPRHSDRRLVEDSALTLTAATGSSGQASEVVLERATITSGWGFALRDIIVPRGSSLYLVASSKTGTNPVYASISGVE